MFLDTKLAVQNLMTLNDTTMYQTASELETRARRATMPGIIAIVSAFIFSVIFTYFINLFVVTPIIRITQDIQKNLDSGIPFEVQVETEDELAKLADPRQEASKSTGLFCSGMQSRKGFS